MANAVLSRAQIAAQKVQSYLVAGSELVLRNVIMDLTADVKIGDDRITIPRMSGLTLKTITPGTKSVGDARDVLGDVLLLDQPKEVSDYLGYITTAQSAVDREIQFFKDAPLIYVKGSEALIAAAFETATPPSGANGNDFASSALAASIPDGEFSFNIKDLAKAKKIADKRGLPKADRYCIVSADGMEILASTQEFQDGSKALSAQALNEGVVSMVKGWKVLQSENISANKVVCFHKSAVAFADQKEMAAESFDEKPFSHVYVALKGLYGCKLLDNGNRKIVITMTEGTAV